MEHNSNLGRITSPNTAVSVPARTRLRRHLGLARLWTVLEERRRLSLVVLLLIVAIFHLWSLLRTPRPNVDDAWYGARAWALIHTGQAFGPLDAGVLDRFPGYWTYLPWLGAFLESLPLRLLGLSLFPVRLTALLFGLLLLVSVYAIGNRLAGPRVGLLTVLLTAFSSAFMLSGHLGRPDIMAAAFGFSAIALYITDDAPEISVKSLLCGLMAGLAFELHPNGIVYGPVVAALYLSDHRLSMLRSRRFWSFVAGLVAGFGFYVGMHIVRYPQTYFDMTSVVVGSSRIPPLLTFDVRIWLQSIREMLALMIAPSHLVIPMVIEPPHGPILWIGAMVSIYLRTPVVIAALVVLRRKRSAAESRTLTILGVLFIAFAALIRHKLDVYAIQTTPAVDLLIAVFLHRLWRQRKALPSVSPRTKSVLNGVIGLFSGLLLAAAALGLIPVLYNPMPDYEATVERIRQIVPRDKTVMGNQAYWFGLPEQTYLSWENIGYYERYAPGGSLEDAFRALRPDYLIIDTGLMGHAIAYDRSKLDPLRQFLYVSRSELEAFLVRHAHLAGVIKTNTFGSVGIYKIDWEQAAIPYNNCLVSRLPQR